MVSKNWFEVDKDGLSKILQRRSKAFVLYELIQNAWDQNVTKVDITFELVKGKHGADIIVEDDDPEGFQDLSHAFTLFAESNKKGDPTKRGRFNLGEKLVLACCEEAEIASTTGGIKFTKDGQRKSIRKRIEKGSIFSAYIKMGRKDYHEVCDSIDMLIPPAGIITTFNGRVLEAKDPIRTFEAILPTEISDNNGNLKKSARKTEVNVYPVEDSDTAYIYEMGIPVVETDDSYHIDIQQKVPLNMDRDNVTPSYLHKVRTFVLNNTSDLLDEDIVNKTWVKEAMSDKNCKDTAVTKVLDIKHGEKRVSFDPSDLEANKTAVSEGYTVIHGSQCSKEEWKNIKRGGTTLPAGQAFPTDHVKSSPDGKPPIDDKDLTDKQKEVIKFSKLIAKKLLGFEILVNIYDVINFSKAWYGKKRLSFNLRHLGNKFFNDFPDNSETVLSLIIHELGHEYCGDHLSSKYYEALTDLGAKLAILALREPDIFPIVTAKNMTVY